MDSSAGDLSKNSFFSYFLKNASDISSRAAKEGYLVLVPTNESIRKTKITKDFVNCHVLRQSPYFKEEFITLDGKIVDVREKVVICKSGFSHNRVISVMFEELYYDDNLDSYKILRITFPLIGKVPENYYKEVEQLNAINAIPLESRSLRDHENAIERILDDSQVYTIINAQIESFVTQFNSSYVMVKGFIESTGTKIRDQCTRIQADAVERCKLYAKREGDKAKCSSRWPSSAQKQQLDTAIECCVMAGVHKKIFTGLCELNTKEDSKLMAMMKKIQDISMVDLGVREELVCDMDDAIIKFNGLNAAITPVQKLAVLQETTRLITKAIDKMMTSKSKYQGDVLTADDIIPMLSYIIIQTYPRSMRFYANAQYMRHFLPTHAPHLEVHITSFQGALAYISSGECLQDQSDSNDELKSDSDVGDWPGGIGIEGEGSSFSSSFSSTFKSSSTSSSSSTITTTTTTGKAVLGSGEEHKEGDIRRGKESKPEVVRTFSSRFSELFVSRSDLSEKMGKKSSGETIDKGSRKPTRRGSQRRNPPNKGASKHKSSRSSPGFSAFRQIPEITSDDTQRTNQQSTYNTIRSSTSTITQIGARNQLLSGPRALPNNDAVLDLNRPGQSGLYTVNPNSAPHHVNLDMDFGDDEDNLGDFLNSLRKSSDDVITGRH